jgi:hypothetical protein
MFKVTLYRFALRRLVGGAGYGFTHIKLDCFTSREGVPGTHQIQDLLRPKFGLNILRVRGWKVKDRGNVVPLQVRANYFFSSPKLSGRLWDFLIKFRVMSTRWSSTPSVDIIVTQNTGHNQQIVRSKPPPGHVFEKQSVWSPDGGGTRCSFPQGK